MWAWLKALLQKIYQAVFKVGADADNNSTKIVSTYEGIIADTQNLITFIDDLKHFDFAPKWKTRVINVPQAFDGINELLDIVFHGIRDRFQELHIAVTVLVDALRGHPPSRGHFGDPGGTLNRVVEYMGDLDTAWKAFGTAYHDAVNLVELIDDVKRRVETLDDLFLQQGNTKKSVDRHYRKRQRS